MLEPKVGKALGSFLGFGGSAFGITFGIPGGGGRICYIG